MGWHGRIRLSAGRERRQLREKWRSERKVRDGSVEKGVCHWFMEETDVHFKEKKKKKSGRDS